MKKCILLAVLTISLAACNGGGGSSYNEEGNSGGGGGTTVGPHWTKQIGTSIAAGTAITYEPINNIIYALGGASGGAVICAISPNASATTAWDCSTVNNALPTGYSITSTNVVADGAGNIYAVAYNRSNSSYYLMKYNGSTWSNYQFTNAPAVSIDYVSNIYYDNGNIYLVSSNQVGSTIVNDLIGFNTSGNYTQTINSVYTGLMTLNYNNSNLSNGKLYVGYLNTVKAISLANTSNVTTYTNLYVSAIAANSNSLVSCGLKSTLSGIYSTPLSTSSWTNIGYTYSMSGANTTIYFGCTSLTTANNKTFVVGSTTSGSAVFAQP